MNKTIYHFDPTTHEYLGQSEADESPLEPGVMLLPGNATRKAPPPVGEREAAVFDAEADDWIVTPDFRSIALYSVLDGSPVAIEDLGPLPPDATDQPRPTPFHDWTGFGWAANLVKIKADKWESIKAERDRRTELGGCLVDGRWYDTDSRSALRYKLLADHALAAGMSDDAVVRAAWRPLDVEMNGEVDMTYGLLKRVMTVGIETAMAIDDAAQNHKAAMLASVDPSAYDYSGGWPEAYTDAEAE